MSKTAEYKKRDWDRKLESIKSHRRKTELLKITRVAPGHFRVCDMDGQYSQYIVPSDMPRAVRKTLESSRVTYAYGHLSNDGMRWIIAGVATEDKQRWKEKKAKEGAANAARSKGSWLRVSVE